MKRRIWTEEEIQFLRDNYPTKGSIGCRETLKRSSVSIWKKADKLKIRKFKDIIDLNSFINITSPVIAYVLGILWADGYLYKLSNDISLELTKADFDEIEPLLDQVIVWKKYFRPQRKNDKPTGTARVSDKDLHSLLREYNYLEKSTVSPRKILEIIPRELQHYWWRGFFEGDGYIHARKRGDYGFMIAGTYNQDWSSAKDLLRDLDVKYRIKQLSKITKSGKLNSSSCLLSESKDGFKKFLGYIYQGEIFGLSRKFRSYQEGLKQIEERSKLRIKYPPKKSKRQSVLESYR